jgi:hypothetical protein
VLQAQCPERQESSWLQTEGPIMYLEIGTRSLEEIGASLAGLASGLTRVWPAEQPIQAVADARLVCTRFDDGHLVHPPAVARILAQGAREVANRRGLGGKKIRDHATWESPEMRLLTLRALLLVCRAREAVSAHVVDRWANVMEHEDYSKPHCHYDADAAVVYALDPGDEDPSAFASGKLEVIDSRIPNCCPNRPERPTRGILPAMPPGMMLTFPAEFLHYVKPYEGQRPRLTLAWNLSVGPPPADRAYDPTQQVVEVVGGIVG